MATTDGLTFVDEILPVVGHDTQRDNGGFIRDAVNDKLLNISGELLVNSRVEWKIVTALKLRHKIIANIGIAAVGGSFAIRIKKNGTFISTPLAIPSGVRVIEFPISELTSRDFVSGDVITVEVVSISGSRSGYHLNIQFNYAH